MKQTAFDKNRDQNIADETGVAQHLMCTAHGCPNRWSYGIGNLCRWHADAHPHRWPEVTQEQQWADTERARERAERPAYVDPLTFADKRAILRKLAALPMRMAERSPRAWIGDLKAREAAGEKLSPMQRAALQAVHQDSSS